MTDVAVYVALWTSKCEVNECGRACKRNLMCSSHWRLVPSDARGALSDAFIAYRAGDRTDETLERVDAAARRCIHAAEVHPRG